MNILESLKLWRFWGYKAILAFRLKYRGSMLGVIWPVASVTIVVLVIGTVWGVLLEKSDIAAYYQYLVCGYSLWMTQSGAVEQGCRALSSKSSGGASFYTVILERLLTAFIPFILVFPLVIAAVFVFGTYDFGSLLLFPILLLLLMFWSLGVISVLVALISFIPDLRHLVNAMMRLAFLATPIIWDVERLGEYAKYIWLNPFFIPLEACRGALIGELDSMLVFYMCLYSVFTLLLGTIALKLRMKEVVK